MTEPEEKPIVKFIGTNGNTFALMGRVKKALFKTGADDEYIKKYLNEAMSGDYDNLLCVTIDYVYVT